MKRLALLLPIVIAFGPSGAETLTDDNPGEPFETILERLAQLQAGVDALADGVATAQDDAVEISQACVLKGCFPDDAPGYPVEIRRSGSYRLGSNLRVDEPSTTAIRVLADGVTLDLNGFEIHGPFTCDTQAFPFACSPAGTGFGIHAVGPAGAFLRGIAIRNGAIVGFDLAAMFVNGGARIEDLGVRECHRGIIASLGIVRRVTVVDVERDGVTTAAGNVSDVVVYRAGEHGISASNVRDSIVQLVGEEGILADVAESNSIRSPGLNASTAGLRCGLCVNNKVRSSSGPGIATMGTTQVMLIGNHVISSDGLGIESTGNSIVAYENNLLTFNNGGNGNPQVGGTGTIIEVGSNVCGDDTVCP